MRTVLTTALALMVVGIYTALIIAAGVIGERKRQRIEQTRRIRAFMATMPKQPKRTYPEPDEATRKAAQA